MIKIQLPIFRATSWTQRLNTHWYIIDTCKYSEYMPMWTLHWFLQPAFSHCREHKLMQQADFPSISKAFPQTPRHIIFLQHFISLTNHKPHILSSKPYPSVDAAYGFWVQDHPQICLHSPRIVSFVSWELHCGTGNEPSQSKWKIYFDIIYFAIMMPVLNLQS